MPKPKEPTITLFCSHCGETKTFRESDNRANTKEGTLCHSCNGGEMIRAFNTMAPGE